ncbi:hypothetical protein CEP51_009116 [Fusarium floridanum]|uniref:Protein kinase domain-containing protein n=1 Tax=Fusarium floridanum TaxID=1325733 RepID=A0A428RIM4_9HYPO|nr:hypothetical protein CEP51_009116 [Fusarium floridanum]
MMNMTDLEIVGLTQDSIWGNESDTLVYAQVLHIRYGRAIIFRFDRNPRHSPKSLANRVVSYYHGINIHNDTLGFRDEAAMRTAIWSSIATIWPWCATDPNVFTPGTVIDLSSDDGDDIIWCVYRSPLFDQYLGLLRDIQKCDLIPPTSRAITMDITKIRLIEIMGGRGCTKLVGVYGMGSPGYFFFKGVDFATYLQHHNDDNEFIRSVVETWRRSSKLIADMPPHPHIQQPPKILVSISDSKAHTHRVLNTFHMDIKLENFLVDSGENLVLIDWEQSGTSPTTLAPEADGTWDVSEEPTAKGTRLVYTKYTGSPRRNMPKGNGPATFHVWNVFPEWQATLPKATELAEVFALGRTMWMVLTQTIDGFDEVKHPDHVRVTWDDANDIPNDWIEMVERCMAKDPNERPGVEDLVKFWNVEKTLITWNAERLPLRRLTATVPTIEA